ncbi:hypothetical protein Sste5346_005646 [Sporothrix stenoceras]|uniref:Uncharacterized protein n=1 Tax=Sporothrix stenoceras TaxID=5173 RepID=A0ABR3Z392_9PEZI
MSKFVLSGASALAVTTNFAAFWQPATTMTPVHMSLLLPTTCDFFGRTAPFLEDTATSANNGNVQSPAEDDNSGEALFHPSLPKKIDDKAKGAASTIPFFAAHNRVSDELKFQMLRDNTVKDYFQSLEKVVVDGGSQLMLEDGIDGSLPELWEEAAVDEDLFLISSQWVSFAPGQQPSKEDLQKRADFWLDRVTQWPELRAFSPDILRKHLVEVIIVRDLMP